MSEIIKIKAKVRVMSKEDTIVDTNGDLFTSVSWQG